MIVSFKSQDTKDLFNDLRPKKLPTDILRVAQRKLMILDAAKNISDLSIPSGNRLEPLKGKRKGQYSIRINAQWRICFYFNKGQASEVEIVDYH